jgi:hypothetical protein
VFKYIKDNKNSKNLLLSNTDINYKKFILPNIQSALTILMIGLVFALFFIDSKIYNQEYTKKINFTNKNIYEENKYEEITISNDNYSNQLNTSTNIPTNIPTTINIKDNKTILYEKKNKNFNPNNNDHKNIWLQSSQNNKSTPTSINLKNIKLINNSISNNDNILDNNIFSENNYILKEDTNDDYLKLINFKKLNDSDVSESEILFGYN